MATANINLPNSDRSLSLFENANKALTQRLSTPATASNWADTNLQSKLQKLRPQVEEASSDKLVGQTIQEVIAKANADTFNDFAPLQIKSDSRIPIGTSGFICLPGMHDGLKIPIQISDHLENSSNTVQKIGIPGARELGLVGKNVELQLNNIPNLQPDPLAIYA